MIPAVPKTTPIVPATTKHKPESRKYAGDAISRKGIPRLMKHIPTINKPRLNIKGSSDASFFNFLFLFVFILSPKHDQSLWILTSEDGVEFLLPPHTQLLKMLARILNSLRILERNTKCILLTDQNTQPQQVFLLFSSQYHLLYLVAEKYLNLSMLHKLCILLHKKGQICVIFYTTYLNQNKNNYIGVCMPFTKKKMKFLLNEIELFCDGKIESDDSYVDQEEKNYYRDVMEKASEYLKMLEGRVSKETKNEIEEFIRDHDYDLDF